MKRVAIIAVVIGVMVFFKMRNQGDDSAAVLSDMKAVISSMEAYEDNADFLDQTLETCHMTVFSDSYDMGSRRRGATFDEDKYIQDVLTLMVKHCNRFNRKELAAPLAELRDAIMAEVEKG